MVKRVVFFNYYHNGDIHVSRGLVRQVMNKVRQLDPNIQFAYAHRNAPNLLCDIPGLNFDSQALSIVNNDQVGAIVIDDTAYFNTWYAQQQFKHMNTYGLTIDSLYSAFNANCKTLWDFYLHDISEDPSVFFPTIDYSKFQITEAKNWLDLYPGKKVFVSNGAILSDQAHHFSLTPIIADLAPKHPNKIFIFSNYDGHPGSANIIHSSDIIKKSGNDLNENAFLSTHCDVIIGKASGSFTFAMTQENIFQRKAKFLAFCNLTPQHRNKFWLSDLLKDKINYTSEFIVSNEGNTEIVSNIINSHLLGVV